MSDSQDRRDDDASAPAPGKTWQQRYGFTLAIIAFVLLVGLMIVAEKSK